MDLRPYVGNTPILKIEEFGFTVWGKSEFMNPGGSVKDRPVSHIISEAEKAGLLKAGDTICEATSGNTGIAFAMFAAQLGYKCVIVMPSNMSEERKKMFRVYGAELIEVEAGNFDLAIRTRDELCEQNGWFNGNQFHSEWNIDAHYATTGEELVAQIKAEGFTPDAFILGTGTGGTLMGTGKKLKEHFPDIKIIAIEPAESPVMSGGEPGLHGIQGIGDGSKFLVDLDFVDQVITVGTKCATDHAKYLATKGLFVGISAGANVRGSFEWLRDNNCKHAITILCDRGERYFSNLDIK
jgi:cysteine synthase A